MTITATVICDSIHDTRLTTLQLRYPRIIHSEFMTHRTFSRNASSSRAIPIEKMIQDVLDDTAMPFKWGRNQPGMQARQEHEHPFVAQDTWLEARDDAVFHARVLSDEGFHKQIANRLLEPFMHINVVVTATEWDNWFALRNHEDADPTIHELAHQMSLAMTNSDPTYLSKSEWHLPYISYLDREEHDEPMLAKMSAARCARVSYGEPRVGDDLKLAEQLISSGHWSPLEHQAYPFNGQCANFNGWMQQRHV